jgi:class 3 adenylate cyclase/tetratricopeptide (TPR) repeat protein
MKCTSCQSENSASSKYCWACGARLTVLCPACKESNTVESSFCTNCGHVLIQSLAAVPPKPGDRSQVGTGERRRAIVLFSDLSGYTELVEQHDPEDADQIMVRVKQAATRIIAKYGGTTNRFIGDEVMALFGIPNADEDDPLRAIRAALELHAEVREKGAEWQTHGGQQLLMHTGINSGLIVAQYSNDLDGLYRVTGDAVNVGARLRGLAAPDEILIGPDVQRQARPYFDMSPCAAVSLKGKAVPLTPYRIIQESGIRSRFEAARARGFKNYIGRGQELDVLQACLARALDGYGQFVTIEGEPGMGKSRLLHEFLRALDRQQFRVPQGRCQPLGSDTPYFPFLNALRRALALGEHDSRAEELNKATANIRQVDPSLESSLPVLLHLLAIPSDLPIPAHLTGEALRRAAEEALAAVITLATTSQPMVLVIEDWHWSDAASQSALRHLLHRAPTHRLMIVVSYRSGYEFDFGQTSNRTALSLHALNKVETERLVQVVTGAASVPSDLGALICQHTDGNPLFIEETCYSLLEVDAISVRDRHIIANKPLSQLQLPDTVQAVIRARLDRLDAGTKEVVGPASVIGRVFDRRILARIYRGPAPLEEVLEVLVNEEIVHQTKTVPEPEYTFRHFLTREVAYDTLLNQQRRQLHEQVGLALEELYPQRREENAAILAHHFAHSSRAEKAVPYALLAGERASRLYANTEATTHFSDALALAKSIPNSSDALRWKIDAVVGQIAVGTGPRDMDTDRANLEEAAATAEQLNDRRRLAQVLYWLGRNHYVRADLERAIQIARKSLEIAEQLGDASLIAPPVNLMGRAYWQLSDFSRSAMMMERNIEQMRSVGNMSEESTAAGFVSALLGYMGAFDRALAYSDRSIKLAKELKNPFAEAAGFHYRGIIRDQQGRWESAIGDYATARIIAEGARDMLRVYIAKFMECRAHHMHGDLERARQLGEESIALASQTGIGFLLGQAKAFLAACCLDADRLQDARALCAEAIAAAEKAGDRFTKALALRTLGETLSLAGVPEEQEKARQAVVEAIAILEAIGAQPELGRSYFSLARLFETWGRTAEATVFANKASAIFERLEMTWDMQRAQQVFAGNAPVADLKA